MQQYQIIAGQGIHGLERVTVDTPTPSDQQVLVRIKAAALNYRDLMIAEGRYFAAGGEPVVPLSDGAGEVVAVGAQVSRFKPGDRVMTSFFPQWQEGAIAPDKIAQALGGSVDGALSQWITLDERSLVPTPAHLDDVQAATLPCAGVTAWNALFVNTRLQPGATVLLLGTGGVSIWALQLAHAAGLRTIVTSSSDAKLERARSLGATAVINYRTTPEWQEQVLALTDGRGADLVLEVGGTGTLARSIASTRMGGSVAIIGGVSGFGGEFSPLALIGGAKQLTGIFVGSRAMSEDLARFTETHGLRPVVDKTFPFEQAREAFEYLKSGSHFGKVVITL